MFGNRSEIGIGSKAEIQSPSCPEWEGPGGGTVMFHSFSFNLQALNGTWNVYKLLHSNTNLPSAAFVCHESLEDPYQEAKSIVDVANAPWEEDSPAMRNTKETWNNRVLVINRYDWMEAYYQEKDEDGITIGEEGMTHPAQRNSRWLVDYQQAQDHPENWNSWISSGKGVRVVIYGEYLYGRFRLTEDKSCVQSFLMFTGDTELAKTTFQNNRKADRSQQRQPPIYIPLTKEERHAKRLADGSYSGYDWLRKCNINIPDDLVGPFEVQDLIAFNDIENILKIIYPSVPIIEPQLQMEVLTLLNESLAVWVYCLGRLASESPTKGEFWNEAFPNRERQGTIHFFQYQFMERKQNLSINLNILYKVVPSSSKLWSYITPEDVSCGIRYLLKEILELAGNSARDSYRNVIVPYDIRVAINNDNDMRDECLNCNKLFWPTDMIGTTNDANRGVGGV